MEKKQAIQLISDTFNAKFNEKQFTLFIKNLLNDVEPKSSRYSGQGLWDDCKDHINTYKRIGKYTDPNGEPLDVLIVEVKTIAKLERARTSLRNFVTKHLKTFDKDFALVAFYVRNENGDIADDWRFSFVKLEHQSYFDEEKDKVKIKEELTPAKRYSFLVGEYEQSHTAKTQLLPLLQNLANNPTVEDLENAFSIEKVTEEFFEQYKDLFKKLSSHFEDNQHIKSELAKAKIDNARFTKKLLGQIVFLYFLQKKGWLGVPQKEKWGKGQKRFIQNLYDTSQKEDTNFFKDKLQYLFYEALAKERNNEHSFYEKFNCRIPFLNGGLFEAEYKWEIANITIPENLFRNQEKNKAGDIGTGVLDVFDRYNFTIKEDEPLDKEVAVDPEMLGKVFENMLEITERKSKGAFYTPREIVHYMCQESLIHYLDNALDGKVKKQDIETYIRKGHNALENDQRVAKKGETKTYKYILPKSIRENADLIDQKLIDIKICDPAIGSGAFPVGLLHELVNAQLVIKPHFTDKYIGNKLKEFGFSKKEQPSESRYIYRLKRHIIQESIYGVDIDASAIDIARLRLWLSLVVDEDDFDPIETLPNLDYKIVCGNSLISRYDLEMPIDNVFTEFNKKVQSKDYQNKAIKNYVGNRKIDLVYYKKLTNDFLLESNHDQKVLFRELISEIKNAFKTVLEEKDKRKLSNARGVVTDLQRSDIFEKQIGTKTQISKAKKLLTKLEKEKKETQDGALYENAVEWRFEFPNLLDEDGDFVGFDVVIANPPYVQIKQIEESHKSIFRNKYRFSNGRFNLFYLFIELAPQLCVNNGLITQIIPDRILLNIQNVNMREWLINEKTLVEIDSFEKQVFSNAVVDSVIVTYKNSLPSNNYFLSRYNCTLDNLVTNTPKIIPNTYVLNSPSNQFDLNYDESVSNILNTIRTESVELNEIADTKDGIIQSKIPDLLFLEEKINNNCKKLLFGKDIEQYSISYSDKWVHYNIELMKKEESLRGGNGLRMRNSSIFERSKILTRQTADRIIGTIDESNYYYYSNTIHGTHITDNNYDSKFVLAQLNSELMTFYYKKITNEGGKVFAQVKIKLLKKVPIKYIDNQNVFVFIVDYLTQLKSTLQTESIFKYFKSILDCLVYELYFEQELKQANKQVLKHLTGLPNGQAGLKPIDDTMSEEEKLAIIQSEFERLYHPEHPVRFAVDTLDSIEEVRIIKEALR